MLNPYTNIKPFDLFTAFYTTFKGARIVGIFMCVLEDNGNVIGCKLTSQLNNDAYNNNAVLLRQMNHPCLQTDSAVQLDKFFNFYSSECRVIGCVAPCIKMFIKNAHNHLFQDILNGYNKEIGGGYVSPNVTKRNGGKF